MPLLKNTFQPFFPDPDSPAPKQCAGEYCNPVSSGDVVTQEWYQTPCAGNIVVDPDFEENVIGAELTTNGTFTGSAAGWTLTGGWTYSADAVQHTGFTSDTVTQAVAITPGNFYQIQVDITTYNAGYINILLGSGAILTQFAYQGSHSAIIIADNINTDLVIQSSIGFDGRIDNVSLKEITFSDWDAGSFIITPGDSTDPGTACHAAGFGILPLINGTSDYIVNGDYYTATVTVSSYGGGSVTLYVDDGTGATATNSQTAITENGEKTYWFTAAQDGVIAMLPSNDFVGCVSLLTVKRLRNDFNFQLIDAAGDSTDISDTAIYIENRILLLVDFAALLEAGTIPDYGCYTIAVTDACLISGDNLVQDGGFSQGTTFWAGGAGAWQYDFTVPGVVTFIFEPLGDNPTLITNGDPIAAGGWTAGANWAFIGTGWQHTPGSTATLSQSITISAPAIPPAQLYIWHQIRISGRTAGSVTVTISTTTSGAMSTNNTYTTLTLPKPTVGGAVTFAITPTSNFDGTIELVAVHEATRIWSGSPSIANPANSSIVAGNYELEYDVTNIVGNTGNQIGGSAWIRNPTFPPGFIPGIGLGTHTHQQLGYVPGSTVIEIGGDFFDATTNYPGRVTIDNYSVVRIEPFEATYESECFNFQESHEGTTLVTGWCDQDALGSTFQDALGFSTSGYKLQMRIRCRSLNPVLKTTGNNAFFSDGSAAIKYAQMEKYWQFVTDYLSEAALIALGGIIRCDHFTIGELGEDATEYLAEMDDLSPSWLQDGSYNLAPVTIIIRKKSDGMKFNRHT